MRLPILEIKRSDGAGALSRHALTRTESALTREMESAVAALPPRAALDDCHRAAAAAGARRGLGKSQSVALWTRATLHLFEADASDRPPAETSPRLQGLVAFAFEHAAPPVRAVGSVAPFLATAGNGPPTLTRFPAPLPARALSDARAAAARLPMHALAYALACVGQSDPRSPRRTLYVEAAERGSPAGHLFARDYRPLSPLGPFEFHSPPARVADAANLMLG